MTSLLEHRSFALAATDDAPADPASAAGGCVVFFTRRADREVAALRRLLSLLGVPSRRVDADRLGSLSLDLRDPEFLGIDGERVRPTLCWTRRFWSSAMTFPRTPAGLLLRQSWLALVRQSPLFAPHAFPGPRLGLIEQLADAARAGVRVPATVVTTEPARAARWLPGARVVVKTLGPHFVEAEPGTLDGAFPRILSRAELADDAERVPVVVQEYVPHLAEYRVYAIRGELITFEVRKPSPGAIWRDQDLVRVREVAAPDEVAALVSLLAARWKVGFGAFDVLLTGRGAVFLEVNLDGDWRWYEARCRGRSVSRGVALAVRDLHAGAGGRVERPAADLLTLMAG